MLKLIWIVLIKTRLNEKVQKPEPCFNENKNKRCCCSIKSNCKVKVMVNVVVVKTGRDVLDNNIAMRQRMISGCSVRFDRIYIEVDEEIISTITDIEGDF